MKYRRKIKVIEAIQYDGDKTHDPEGVMRDENGAYVMTIHLQRSYLMPGDWILPEPDGIHYYPCKDVIFRDTYEAIEDDFDQDLKAIHQIIKDQSKDPDKNYG